MLKTLYIKCHFERMQTTQYFPYEVVKMWRRQLYQQQWKCLKFKMHYARWDFFSVRFLQGGTLLLAHCNIIKQRHIHNVAASNPFSEQKLLTSGDEQKIWTHFKRIRLDSVYWPDKVNFRQLCVGCHMPSTNDLWINQILILWMWL